MSGGGSAPDPRFFFERRKVGAQGGLCQREANDLHRNGHSIA
jgi:hypothetical protein